MLAKNSLKIILFLKAKNYFFWFVYSVLISKSLKILNCYKSCNNMNKQSFNAYLIIKKK